MTRKTATAPRRPEGHPARAVPPAPPRAGTRLTIEAVRAAWGAALLFGPGIMLEQVFRVRADSRSIAVARLLGARHVAQAVLSGSRPAPAVLALGVWVDTAHAGTALAFAAADRPRARAAIFDGAVAAGWAAAGFRDLARSWAPRAVGERRRDHLARTLLRHLPAGPALLARTGPS